MIYECLYNLLFLVADQQVCFAEAGNDVVVFLSTLLCLLVTVSTIISLVTKERMVVTIKATEPIKGKSAIISLVS
jgi:hypothetical protein